MTRTGGRGRRTPRSAPESAEMDGRIAERRRAVEEEERRHSLRGLVALGGGLVLAAVLAALLMSPLIGVRRIEVVGARESAAGEVVRVSGVREGESLLRLGTARATSSVETLPWVRRARITRSLPGTVKIRVTERRAVAVGQVGPDAALLDASGRVLRDLPPGSQVPRLAVVTGETPLPAPGSRWRDAGAREALAAATGLPGELLGRATAIRLAEGRLTVVLEGGTEVVFGSAVDLQRKARVALAVLAETASRQMRPARVDVTSPTAPAIQ